MSGGARRVVPLGRVAGVYGVRGWVRVRSDTDPPTALLDYERWLVGSDGRWTERTPVEGRAHGAGLVVRIAGVDDRDAARTLNGLDVAVSRDELPPLEDDEHYWTDLVGLEVRGPGGDVLGRVTGLLETGANDVLVVRDGAGAELLIPYLPGRVVERVAVDEGVIEVDWDADYL